MALPKYATVLSEINTYIVANGNNEITANVLNPILKIILDFSNNNLGDLDTLTTDQKNSIVEAVNSLKSNFDGLVNNGVQLYTGINDPNDIPPPAYKYADFYMQVDIDSLPVKLWQWNGFVWTDASEEPATDTDNVDNNSDVPGTTATDALNYLNSNKANNDLVVHLSGDETITGIKTFDNLSLISNPIGSTPHKIRQVMGENDFFEIFGEASELDKGVMVFIIGDNGEPFSGIGQKFAFRYADTGGGIAKTVLEIDYNNMTMSGTVTAQPATDSNHLVTKSQNDLKLNISDYNQYFQGKYSSLSALEIAKPTGNDGDYAIVDAGVGQDAQEYVWDSEDGWVEGGSAGASTTDALPEGSTNLYFTTARGLAMLLTGISFATGGAIVSTDSILVAFGKIQKNITDLISGKQNKLVAGKNVIIDTTDALNPAINATTTKNYNAVMHFGNSICRHPILDGTWWGDWGMAATIRDNDYVHRFWSMLKTINPNATSDALNIAPWETNYATFNKATLDPYLVGKDLVVLRLGENVTYYADFQNQYKILVQYIQTQAPTADIILGGQFWVNATKETAMQNVAVELGLPFVSVKHLDSATYKQTAGGVVQGDDGLPHTITNSGVANHPNDLGMLKIAEALFADISYTTEINKITPQKEIIGSVTLDNSYNGCIVKVKATATITVPATLKANFNCVFDTWTGFTSTFVAGSGVTISSSGLKLLSEKMGTLYKDGDAPYFRLKGETSV